MTPRDVKKTDKEFIIERDDEDISSEDEDIKIEKERKAQELLRINNAKGVMFIIFSTIAGTLQLLTTKLFFTNLEGN